MELAIILTITRMLVVSSLVADWLQAVLGNGLAPIAKNNVSLCVLMCLDVSLCVLMCLDVS